MMTNNKYEGTGFLLVGVIVGVAVIEGVGVFVDVVVGVGVGKGQVNP